MEDLGECADQGQAPADPALVLSEARGDIVLRESIVDQTGHQPGLFNRLQTVGLVLADDSQYGFAEGAFFNPCQGGVPPHLAQGLYAAIAVDEYQAIRVSGQANGLTLPISLEGLHQLPNARWVHDAHGLIASIQAMQVDFCGRRAGAVHGGYGTPGSALWL